MKPSFLHHDHPLFTVMIQTETAENAIRTIHRAIPEGADAFGLQTCKLLHEYRNIATYQRIFAELEDKPVYITNYRHHANDGVDDDGIAAGLIMATEAGGTLMDVMGDMFDRQPDEVAVDPKAIDKQRKLINTIHDKGGEVLMSSHVLKYTPAERVVEIALEQQARGADVIKIVTGADTVEQEIENLRITHLLRQELKRPFLFLSGGSHNRIHRRLGCHFGCSLYLCVYEHDAMSTPSQPTLKYLKTMLENFDKA